MILFDFIINENKLFWQQAGLVSPDDPDRLLIALEPEAVSIFCRRLKVFQMLSSSTYTAENVGHRDSTDITRTSSQSLPELRSTEVSLMSNDLEIGILFKELK